VAWPSIGRRTTKSQAAACSGVSPSRSLPKTNRRGRGWRGGTPAPGARRFWGRAPTA
jgi:hypothetical protein